MSIRSLPFLTTVKNMDDGMDKFLMTTFIHVLCFSQVKLHLQMLVLNQLDNIYVGPDQLLSSTRAAQLPSSSHAANTQAAAYY